MTFPIFEHLYKHLCKEGKEKNVLNGVTIGWHCHLTELTAVAAQTVVDLGAQLHLSECNPNTTSLAAAENMRKMGASVYLGPTCADEVLKTKPLVISDTGFHLTSQYLNSRGDWLIGGCEITTSGITKMRQLELPLPIINLNDTTLKSTIENFHGVGEGLIEALSKVSQKNFRGRNVSVVGYGQVGAGCAHYLKSAGAVVSIVEKDSVRALKAHFDGYKLQLLSDALKSSELLVTASGQTHLLSTSEWQIAIDGILIANVGHFADELDIPSLDKIARRTNDSSLVQEFTLDNNLDPSAYKTDCKKIYIATEGHPINVVLLTGSPEPTLIHLATEILALAYLVELNQHGQKLNNGENSLPRQIEELVSLLAIRALNLSHNPQELVNENWQNRDRDLESSTQTC
jgi:adenosylhomocysteinase